jgi:hypothetical protein
MHEQRCKLQNLIMVPLEGHHELVALFGRFVHGSYRLIDLYQIIIDQQMYVGVDSSGIQVGLVYYIGFACTIGTCLQDALYDHFTTSLFAHLISLLYRISQR